MSGVVEFLLARLDEDERAVLDGWDSDGKARVASVWTGPEPGYTTVASDQGDGEWVADGRDVSDARGVQVLFDPIRVLADVAAKRRIVEEHREAAAYYREHPAASAGEEYGLLTAIKALATAYSSHPDFDKNWRP